MRTRLLAPLVVLVVVAVVLLVVPALGALARDRTATLSLDRRAQVERIAALAQSAVEHDGGVALRRHVERYHELFGEDVLVVLDDDCDGEPLATTRGISCDDPEVQQRLDDFGAALDGLRIPAVQPWSADRVLVSTPVELSQSLSTGTVVMEVDTTAARTDVRQGWLTVLLGTALLLGLLVVSTLWWSRWILRPVHELDEATTALAAGEPVDLLGSGPPELRRLARSFRAMATTLSTALTKQRELVGNTSHQLRNPLAAVRLHVDLLDHDDQPDRETVEAVQRGLDRLEDTVARLLALAEAEHRLAADRAARVADDLPAAATPVEVLLSHVRSEWGPRRTAGTGARVTAHGDGSLVVALPEHDLLEVVDTLVENGVKYGGDGASVQLRADRSAAGRVAVVVDDDGDGLSDEELGQVGERFWRADRHAAFPGTGLGLVLVDALVRAAGGTMTVGRSPRGGLEVRLDLPEAAP